MTADLAAAITPGFRQFLVVVGALVVGSTVLAIAASSAGPVLARRARMINRYVLLVVLAVIILFPIYITVVNSFLSPDRIAARPPTLVPPSLDFGVYGTAWNQGHISSYLFNSFAVTFVIVAGQLLTSICAAYAFAFLAFPLKRTIFVVFLATMMVPFEVV